MRRVRGPLLLLAAALVALTACGGPGSVELTGAPQPTGQARTACTELVAALPKSLGKGLDRRDVKPPVATAAAFGSDPIVLTCGASGVAASFRPTSMLSDVNGVGWFTEELGTKTRYSTPTRSPQVVLTLPADRQAFEILVDLAPAVTAHTRVTTS